MKSYLRNINRRRKALFCWKKQRTYYLRVCNDRRPNEKRHWKSKKDSRDERKKERVRKGRKERKKGWQMKSLRESRDGIRLCSALNFRQSLSGRSLWRPDLRSTSWLFQPSPARAPFRAECASVMLRCTATCNNVCNERKIVAPWLIGKFTTALEIGHNIHWV